jgi:hypothetical protein
MHIIDVTLDKSITNIIDKIFTVKNEISNIHVKFY